MNKIANVLLIMVPKSFGGEGGGEGGGSSGGGSGGGSGGSSSGEMRPVFSSATSPHLPSPPLPLSSSSSYHQTLSCEFFVSAMIFH